jgi:hypothetical protein
MQSGDIERLTQDASWKPWVMSRADEWSLALSLRLIQLS